MVYDVITKAVDRIPCLVGSNVDYVPDEACGIQALSINPSRCLLAAGGKNSNEIGIYKLPTLDPAYIAEVKSTTTTILRFILFDINGFGILRCYSKATMIGYTMLYGWTISL